MKRNELKPTTKPYCFGQLSFFDSAGQRSTGDCRRVSCQRMAVTPRCLSTSAFRVQQERLGGYRPTRIEKQSRKPCRPFGLRAGPSARCTSQQKTFHLQHRSAGSLEPSKCEGMALGLGKENLTHRPTESTTHTPHTVSLLAFPAVILRRVPQQRQLLSIRNPAKLWKSDHQRSDGPCSSPRHSEAKGLQIVSLWATGPWSHWSKQPAHEELCRA